MIPHTNLQQWKKEQYKIKPKPMFGEKFVLESPIWKVKVSVITNAKVKQIVYFTVSPSNPNRNSTLTC